VRKISVIKKSLPTRACQEWESRVKPRRRRGATIKRVPSIGKGEVPLDRTGEDSGQRRGALAFQKARPESSEKKEYIGGR